MTKNIKKAIALEMEAHGFTPDSETSGDLNYIVEGIENGTDAEELTFEVETPEQALAIVEALNVYLYELENLAARARLVLEATAKANGLEAPPICGGFAPRDAGGRATEAKRIIDGLRLYRRGLRFLEQDRREEARGMAEQIAQLTFGPVVENHYRRQMEMLEASEDMRGRTFAEVYDTIWAGYALEQHKTTKRTGRILSAILDGGRNEEARLLKQKARRILPWQTSKRIALADKATANTGEFVEMVRAGVDALCEKAHRRFAGELVKRNPELAPAFTFAREHFPLALNGDTPYTDNAS